MILTLTLVLGLAQQSVTLTATDSKCISSLSQENWNDNRFRAYWGSPAQGFVDGLVKFDLSSIPDGSTIRSMTLRAYHEAGFGNPYDNPEVTVLRSSGDGWSRSQTDAHPGIAEVLTQPQTGFPSNDLVPVDFVLNVNAAFWEPDLADNVLTLVLRNVAGGSGGRYSYVYFYGSDVLPAPPELTVTYTDGPVLTVTNLTAGNMASFTVTYATPGGYAGIVMSPAGAGPTLLNAGHCGPMNFAVSRPLSVLGVIPVNGAGVAVVNVNVPAGAAGRSVWSQGLDIASCELTNPFAGVVG